MLDERPNQNQTRQPIIAKKMKTAHRDRVKLCMRAHLTIFMSFCLIFYYIYVWSFSLSLVLLSIHLFTLGALFVSCSDRVDKLRLYNIEQLCALLFFSSTFLLLHPCAVCYYCYFVCVYSSLAFGIQKKKRNTSSINETMQKTRSHLLQKEKKCCNHFYFFCLLCLVG